jgi:hypothetical protein
MRCNDGLIIWWAVEVLARLHREGGEVGNVDYQHLPVQRLLLRLVLVGHGSELGKAKPQRKVGGGVGVLLRLDAGDCLN